MTLYEPEYTNQAFKDLAKLHKNVTQKILAKIIFFCRQKNPLKYAKKLTNPLFGTYRFRIGNYRAIFDIDDKGIIKILLIITIKHRKDIYRKI